MSEDRSAKNQWLDSLEGSDVPLPEGELAYCDTCAEPITPNSRCQTYYSDHSFHTRPPKDLGRLATMALYGPCHARQWIILPCYGVNEVLCECTLHEDGTMHDFAVVDASSKEKGTPWDPSEVMAEVLGFPIELWHATTQTLFGPGDIADLFLAIDLDIAEFVDTDSGDLDATEDDKQRAREAFAAFMADSLASGKTEQVLEKGERMDDKLAEKFGYESADEMEGHIYFDAEDGEWVLDQEDDDE